MSKYFKKHKEVKYDYPEDMAIILSYLRKKGTLLASGDKIESLYFRYSDEEWDAGWIGLSADMMDDDYEEKNYNCRNPLKEFMEWLDNLNDED